MEYQNYKNPTGRQTANRCLGPIPKSRNLASSFYTMSKTTQSRIS